MGDRPERSDALDAYIAYFNDFQFDPSANSSSNERTPSSSLPNSDAVDEEMSSNNNNIEQSRARSVSPDISRDRRSSGDGSNDAQETPPSHSNINDPSRLGIAPESSDPLRVEASSRTLSSSVASRTRSAYSKENNYGGMWSETYLPSPYAHSIDGAKEVLWSRVRGQRIRVAAGPVGSQGGGARTRTSVAETNKTSSKKPRGFGDINDFIAHHRKIKDTTPEALEETVKHAPPRLKRRKEEEKEEGWPPPPWFQERLDKYKEEFGHYPSGDSSPPSNQDKHFNI